MKKSLSAVMSLCIALSVHAETSTNSPTPLPVTIVQGVGTSSEAEPVAEAAPVGPYNQPEWTTARRFPTTRVYLQQMPGEVGVEQWVKSQWPRGTGPNYSFEEEVEIGLPHRFQFDLYEVWDVGPVDNNRPNVPNGKVMEDCISTELRYALADWGKIFGNPTVYAEWTFRNHALGADRYEIKLLLGDQIAQRWHWGANIVFEQEVGQVRTREYSGDAAISYTMIDRKLSVGLELKVENEAPQSNPLTPIEVDLGPSIQWRPTRNTHLDVVPLVGLTSDSPHVEMWIVFGYDFGSGSSHKEISAPVSMRSQ